MSYSGILLLQSNWTTNDTVSTTEFLSLLIFSFLFTYLYVFDETFDTQKYGEVN